MSRHMVVKQHRLDLNPIVDLRAEVLDCCGVPLSRLFKTEGAREKFRSVCVINACKRAHVICEGGQRPRLRGRGGRV